MRVWRDDTDLTQLSQRLRVGPRELIDAIGGPWFVVARSPLDEVSRAGTLFLGRAGPSVGVLVGDQPVPDVLVGVAIGDWTDPATLVWSLAEPVTRLVAVAAHAPDAEVASMLERMGRAVDDAYEAKRPDLVTCRYCGTLVAPEHALGDDMCHACGSRLLDIVY